MRFAISAWLLLAAGNVGAQPWSGLEWDVRVCALIQEDASAAACVRQLVVDLDKKKADAVEQKRASAEAAKKKKSALPSQRDLDRDAARAQVRDSYLQALERLNPSLNHIQIEFEGSKKAGAVFGVHTYFTRHSFEIGGLGPGVQRWINANHKLLETACITRVGVMDRQDRSKTWYNMPYKAPC